MEEWSLYLDASLMRAHKGVWLILQHLFMRFAIGLVDPLLSCSRGPFFYILETCLPSSVYKVFHGPLFLVVFSVERV